MAREEFEFSSPAGLRFATARHNFSSFAMAVEGARDLEIWPLIARHVRPGGVFVDAGANVGTYAIPAATLVGPTGRVVAFEAHPRTFRLLQRGIALNGLTQMTALQQALGAAPGEIAMAYAAANPGETHVAAGTEGGGRVPMTTLDLALPELGIGA
ncbi:FkbM family methyltransferase, partial [Siccirubricoccus sp. KC 17139]|nr:FkbM family methyltransferase [Siccirubricoccus soli]MCP2681374.1 FkbM family methyltransferase [Siccirubricoccus soli]